MLETWGQPERLGVSSGQVEGCQSAGGDPDRCGSSPRDHRELSQDHICHARPDTGRCEVGPVTEDRHGKRRKAVGQWKCWMRPTRSRVRPNGL
ncbi:hypothetical protein NDU88_005890 [Pleurodeles waltl]|uniref:Uncharacterized protein n=1 Tax=Pleurodeles waltl TaxID=8319 RepID=A0AAV7TVI9_PLEWA|nr:hypothetical protein NDU88_005890 [Pleurodeles waltl]